MDTNTLSKQLLRVSGVIMTPSLTKTPESDRRGGGRPSEGKSNQHHNKSRLCGRRGGKVRVREHGFPATEVSRCQSEPWEELAPKRQTLEGHKPHTLKFCCQKSVNTFSHVGACLAYRFLKNRKSLTAAEPTGCDDGTVIDIDALSCCGRGAR